MNVFDEDDPAKIIQKLNERKEQRARLQKPLTEKEIRERQVRAEKAYKNFEAYKNQVIKEVIENPSAFKS